MIEKPIKSVADLLDVLDSIDSNVFGLHTVSSETLYRGQSKNEWKLTPSLFRNDLFQKETYMIKRIQHLAVTEFDSLDRFSQLVKLQHYGLPTRILDLTENPLVALYFACIGNIDEDGAIYIFNNYPTHWSDDPLVETYMDFVFEIGFNNISVEDYLKLLQDKKTGKYSSRRKIISEKDLIYDLSLKGVAVYPKKNNERIISQQGAFLLFGSNFIGVRVSDNPGTYGKRYLHFDSNTPEELPKNIKKIKVKSSAKKQILNELDLLGINGMKLFPELDSIVGNVVENTKKELKI